VCLSSTGYETTRLCFGTVADLGDGCIAARLHFKLHVSGLPFNATAPLRKMTSLRAAVDAADIQQQLRAV
jgi:hypothetical protein